MLERLHFVIAPAVLTGYALLDGVTGVVVGSVARRGSLWGTWFGRADALEAREPPDGSLVFTLTRAANHAELSDGQDHAVWRYRTGPRGTTVVAAKGGIAARVKPGVASTLSVNAASGEPMGVIAWAGARLKVELAPALADHPFDKMLVLGAALNLLMRCTRH